MNFSFYIAKRYLFSPGSSNAINIITGIAAAGVVIGAMSLFIVLSGFSGLKDFSLQFSTFFDPDLKVFPKSGKTFTISEQQKQALSGTEGVVAFSEIIEERAILEFRDKQGMAFIKGVDASYKKVIATDSILSYGNWLSGNDSQVVVGSGISRDLSIGVEQVYTNFLVLYVPKPGKGIPTNPSQAFRKQAFVNIGVYGVNEELDKKFVFTTVDAARNLLGLTPDKVTYLEIKTDVQVDQQRIRERIQKIFNNQVTIKNRMQLNDTLYKMLNTENLASYLIITLIAIIALLNVAGAIIMMIIDKKANLQTLYNIGSPIKDIRKIFLYQGFLMTILGTFTGLLLGALLIFLQQKYYLLMITPSLPYPTKFSILNFVIVFITIVSIGGIASYLAAIRINKRLISS